MNPAATGTIAARTPVTGATTPIRPTARPWYSATIPTTPRTPATSASATDDGSGNASRNSTAAASIATSPNSWTTNEAPSTGARRLAQPPPKSPVPSATDAPRPRTTTARPGPTRSAVGRHSRFGQLLHEVRDVAGHVGLGSVVELGRPGQRDDRISRGVVAIRRRQVDHLEVARDVAQELERAAGAGIVKRHERVVEDQGRPAVAGDEPDEADPGDQVHEVEGALAERRDVDPVAALRGVDA